MQYYFLGENTHFDISGHFVITEFDLEVVYCSSKFVTLADFVPENSKLPWIGLRLGATNVFEIYLVWPNELESGPLFRTRTEPEVGILRKVCSCNIMG